MSRSIAGAVLLAVALPGYGGNFDISPLRLELSRQKPISSLNLRNRDEANLLVQGQLTRWTQSQGKDAYAESDDLLFNPPIFTVEPGKSQVIRVGWSGGPGEVEQAYRLFLQEVPTEAAGGPPSGLRLVLRMAVPIFIPPAVPKPQLRMDALRLADGSLSIGLANTGNVHYQVRNLRLLDSGTEAASMQVIRYVLAGQSVSVAVKPTRTLASGQVQVELDTNRGKVSEVLPLLSQ